ncbi:hypothetical protein MKX03_006598 [Papaver bracteatum]|nr:hypothetical protein MKX03_006598 [Papaver bracteatum]
MELSLRSRILVLFLGLFISTPNYIKHTSGLVCNQQEIKYLLIFKNDLKDPLSQLSSWSGEDCFKWNGVICNNETQIVELNLLSFMLGGELSPSLQELKQPEHSLVQLNLNSNNFGGAISKDISQLTSLTSLELSANELEGEIPTTMRNLCNLQVIDLSGNKFRGEISGFRKGISAFLKGTSSCLAGSLRFLSLEVNQFTGPLPDHLGNLHKLDYVSIKNNEFSGSIPFSLGRLSLLGELDLRYNQLNGSLPASIRNFSNLEILRISYNSLEGVVPEAHFDNLTKLQTIEMNSLVIKFSPRWIPPFQLIGASFRSCQLGPHTGIASTVPTWFWNMTSQFTYLNLSNNQITGELPKFFKSSPFSAGIYLNSNQFTGQLPRISSDIRELDLSNNSFSGSISKLLCDQVNANRLRVLDLSRNLLSGEIPHCWMYWRSLKLVRLGSNNLTGNIPSSMGKLILLQSLHLRNNSLTGELPLSLQNCTELRTMDLGDRAVAKFLEALGELT